VLKYAQDASYLSSAFARYRGRRPVLHFGAPLPQAAANMTSGAHDF
jgi:hypothetical protein